MEPNQEDPALESDLTILATQLGLWDEAQENPSPLFSKSIPPEAEPTLTKQHISLIT